MFRLDERKMSNNDISMTTHKNEEYRLDHLNWRDDGDEVTDPSTNDFLKGYNINPYEFKQWACKKHKSKYITAMKKKAAREVFVMQFSPEFLADRILTIWNGQDGPLQNCYEGFTLRYNNLLKKQIADCLASKGYQVYPQYIDDKPRYASRLLRLMTKVAKSKNINNIIHFATTVSHSDNLQLFAGELADAREYGQPISMEEARGILKYYQNCFPEDYALKMTEGLMNSKVRQKVDFKQFNSSDWDFSDESLKSIEDYMRADKTSYLRDGGVSGWNFTTDMRNFDGTAPGRYEITGKRLQRNSIYKRADRRVNNVEKTAKRIDKRAKFGKMNHLKKN